MATTAAPGYQAINNGPSSTSSPAAGKQQPAAPASTPASTAPASSESRLGPAAPVLAAPRSFFHAVHAAITAPTPDLNLYCEPIDPAASVAPRDRIQLALESCRPWAEFLDIHAINLPKHPTDIKPRLYGNLETFFYNYLVVTVAFMVGLGLFDLGALFLLAAALALAYFFFVLRPDPIQVASRFAITKPFKIAILAIFSVFVLICGGVFSLLFSSGLFGAIVFVLHALFHDKTVPATV